MLSLTLPACLPCITQADLGSLLLGAGTHEASITLVNTSSTPVQLSALWAGGSSMFAVSEQDVVIYTGSRCGVMHG